MTTRALGGCLVALSLWLLPDPSLAQPTPAPPPASQAAPQPPDALERAAEDQPVESRSHQEVVRVGSDYVLAPGDTVREAVIISGSATIGGRVDGDLVVILGQVRLSSTAVIDGSLVVIGGGATIAPGATVDHDLVVIGGEIDSPAGFAPGGEHVVIGNELLGGGLERLSPWIVRGLMWGRLIVPDLPWVWSIVVFLLIIALAINALFAGPVRAVVAKLEQRPVSAFLTGLLTLILAGPFLLLLGISVVGIIVIPFAICALGLAMVVGRVGVTRWLGGTIVAEGEGGQLRAARSLLIGFVLLCIAYMTPVLAFVVWGLVGVLGLGAAVAAFMSAYRRENPRPERPVAPKTAPAAVMQGGGGVPPHTAAHAMDVPPIEHASGVIADPPLAGAGPRVNGSAFPFASFGERLAAFLLDLATFFIAVSVLEPRNPATVFLLVLIYFVLFWTFKGTTLGGLASQIRVVRTNGEPLGLSDSIVRALACIPSLAPLGIGGLWILKDREHQAWHDKLAGTYVVKVPKGYPF